MKKICCALCLLALLLPLPIAASASPAEELQRKIVEVGELSPEALAPMLKLVAAYRSAGAYEEAVRWSEKALANCRAAYGDNHALTTGCKVSLATDYRNAGNYAKAVALDEEAFLWRQQNLGEKNPETLTSMSNLAVDYRRLGQSEKAQQLDEKTFDLRRAVLGEEHSDTLISMNNLASDLRQTGRYEEAMALDAKVLQSRIRTLGEDNRLTLTSLNNLASDRAALGRYSEAAELQRKAAEISTRLLGEQHPETLTALGNLALTYSRMGRYNETLPLEEKIFQKRLASLGEKNIETLLSANNLAGDYYTQGRYAEAAEKMQLLLNGVEELRRVGDLSPEARQTLFAKWIPSYKTYAFISQAQKKDDKAFLLTEMSKARTLLELTAERIADEGHILADDESAKISEYQSRIAVFNERISAAAEQVQERVALEAEKRSVLENYAQYRRAMMDKYPKYRQLSEVTLLDAAAGAKLLRPEEVFISYLVTQDNKALVFLLQPNGSLKTVALGLTPRLEESAQVYHDLLSYRDINQLSEAGKYLWKYPDGNFTLSESLLKPDETLSAVKDNKSYYDAIAQLAKTLSDALLLPLSAELKDKKHLIISPDGALSLIPFETLTLEGKTLIMEHDISYIQSLSVLAQLKEREREQGGRPDALFAMGAAYYQGTVKYSASNIRLRGNGLQDLKSSEPEMDALSQIFKDSPQAIYKRDDSTEAKLQELNRSRELAGFKYLVFSAHGYFDDKNPALNAIVLGQKNLTPGTDGFITVNKWPAYELNSSLIYLSACETGRGRFVPGEGLLGLTYALFVAGNKNTIATLWKTMDDDSAVRFTGSFFAKLKNGATQAQALSATKREFISEGKYSRPVFWAPFVLYGI